MGDEVTKEQIAALAAANRKKRQDDCIVNAIDLVAQVAEGLAGIKGTAADEVRIELMGKLREAIHHINEAG